MRLFIFSSLFIICLSAGIFSENVYYCKDSLNSRLNQERIEFSYAAGKYITIDENYAQIELFSPLFSSPSYLVFLDLYGYRFDHGKWASSLGGGIRKSLSNGNILGFNTYYDYRRGLSKHSFHRLGLGVEWLNNYFNFRINGYLPISNKSHSFDFYAFDNLGDGFFATKKTIEYMYSGFDAEIGTPWLNFCNFNLHAGAGPYYFSHSHYESFWGGLGRIEIDWKSFLSLQILASYDHIHSTKVQALIQLTIPLDFSYSHRCGNCCNGLLIQPIQRNGLILTDHCCDWTWNW